MHFVDLVLIAGLVLLVPFLAVEALCRFYTESEPSALRTLNMKTDQKRPITRRDKVQEAKKKKDEEIELIKQSGLKGEEKKMAIRHTERNFAKKMKEVVDAS